MGMSDMGWQALHQPCPKCTSSDAYSIDPSGHGHCFSCGYDTRKDKNFRVDSMDKKGYNESVEYGYFPFRGISENTLKKFGVIVEKDTSTDELTRVAFSYGDKKAWKFRSLKEKRFWWKGPASEVNLFGKELFPPGSAKAITITEGEIDALSVYEMMGDWPVVSVKSASEAKRNCANEFDYLNSFEKIYICFDSDEPGRNAARQVAELFDFNKVYLVKLDPYKDANELLQEGKVKEFRNCWYNARRFLPDNLVSTIHDFKTILESVKERPSIPYPWPKISDMTYGIRTSEIVLLTALEGIGKTEIVRAIEYHVLKTTPSSVGIIHLEETPDRTLKGLAGLELGTPCHLPTSNVSNEDILSALDRLGARNERINVYTHYGSTEPDDILSAIRFLASACGCKYIFLDHITMIVTGLEDADERRTLDYISTKLGSLVRELDFALFLVSHENDNGQTRGSRNISKIADTHIRLVRDKLAHSDVERNTTELYILKNRVGAQTGPADKLLFDPQTFTLSPIEEIKELPPNNE